MNRVLLSGLAGLAATVPTTMHMAALCRRLPRQEQDPLPPYHIAQNAAADVHVEQELSEAERTGWAFTVHFGYGAAAGGVYALVEDTLPQPTVLRGALYGLLVWTASYMGLMPALGLYPPARREAAARNALMIAAHLVWGPVLALLVEGLCGEGEGSHAGG